MKTENYKLQIRRRALILLLAFSLAATSIALLSPSSRPPAAHASWYSNSWDYRQKITINHAKVANTDQSGFPVLVKITESGNPVFTRAQDGGGDILFTSSNETTKLSHEIELFSKGGKELVAWVKVPSLSASSNTVLYMYYGNPTAENQENKTDVWTNGYAGVWHKDDATASTINDSTTSANHGTKKAVNEPIEADGKIGEGQSYDGNDYIQTSDTNFPLGDSDRTVSAWVYVNSYISPYSHMVHYGNSATGRAWGLAIRSTDKQLLAHEWAIYQVAGVVPRWEWVHVAITLSDKKYKTHYINGINVGQPEYQPNTVSLGYSRIGARISTPTEYFNGLIDEVRISSVARSADWIATEYNNQSDPGSFYTLGDELHRDHVAPSNPTVITATDELGGAVELSSGGFYNYPTPYFYWPAAEEEGGASDSCDYGEPSGVAGYYSYFGANCSADPTMTRGVLPEEGESGLHFSAQTSVSVPSLGSNTGTYCLRVKTKDNAGNIQGTAWAVFTYTYDATPPSPPSFVATAPSGYTAKDSYFFSWPQATDGESTPQSGIAGYQYKRGEGSGDDWSATQAERSVDEIRKYQDGANIFLVRSVDNAGNTSSSVQTNYYYTDQAPVKPGNLAVEPIGISSVNSFSFSWDTPVHDHAITDYGYSINAWPSEATVTWTGSSDTHLAAGPYATQQGGNDFYLVAKDIAGNYAFDEENVARIDFWCTSPAPPAPVMLGITDSSNRGISLWSLTVKWSAGQGQGASFSHYALERSTNGVDFTRIATSTSVFYVDSGALQEGVTYFYRVKALDNAGAVSSSSSIISKKPTGDYETPPSIIRGPDVSTTATGSVISWVTNRESLSAVRYGEDQATLPQSKATAQATTEHSITLDNLSPLTTYHYQVQSLDENRLYGTDNAYSKTFDFTTGEATSISDVAVSGITLSSAELTWETSAPSNCSLRWGRSIDYGESISETTGSYVTRHTIDLDGLSHSTLYHLKAFCEDTDRNSFSSDDYTFETKQMPKIFQIGYQTDSSGPAPAIAVSWKTNVPTSSSINYRPKDGTVTFEESEAALITDHKLIIGKLQDNTEYRFVLSGRDEFGNQVASDEQVMITDRDTRPPAISVLTIETSNVGVGREDKAQIIVSWETDEPATSKVEYAQGIAGDQYTASASEGSALTEHHLVVISDLESSAPHHLRVCSTDEAGNTACSADQTIVAGEVKRSLLAIILSAFQRLFGWIRI